MEKNKFLFTDALRTACWIAISKIRHDPCDDSDSWSLLERETAKGLELDPADVGRVFASIRARYTAMERDENKNNGS